MAMQPRRKITSHRIEFGGGNIAWARQFYAMLTRNAPRAWFHHHNTVSKENGFLNRMGYEKHGELGALPDIQQFILQALNCRYDTLFYYGPFITPYFLTPSHFVFPPF
jgi:hypothetical protein